MFTGIVSDVGVIRDVEKHGDTRFRIGTSYDIASIVPGASIACAGICLTVVSTGSDGQGNWFCVDASSETLNCTTAKNWGRHTRLNLERALKIGDELGGHIVTGHVDGVGKVDIIAAEGGSHRISIVAPKDIAGFIAPKGSITVDGVSLTVNEVNGPHFGVNIIPHSWKVTALSDIKAGGSVNLEIDVLARYVSRLHQNTIKA